MSSCLCVSGGGWGGGGVDKEGGGGGAVEDKRGQKGVEGKERKWGHSNFSHVQCLLFFVYISPSHDTLDTTHSNMLTCIATRMGGSHSVGLKPRLSVSDFTLKKKKKRTE